MTTRQTVRRRRGRLIRRYQRAGMTTRAARRRVITWETTPPTPPTYRHARPVLTRRHR